MLGGDSPSGHPVQVRMGRRMRSGLTLHKEFPLNLWQPQLASACDRCAYPSASRIEVKVLLDGLFSSAMMQTVDNA
jgi:hypothetical protein